MGSGRPHLALIAALLLTTIHLTSASIWHISIDEGPAPPPDKGPPLSYHASRDPSLLKYQIIGIVGGYIGAVLIIGVALLTVGRRWRLAVEKSPGTLSTEMVKPTRHMLETSPLSPTYSERSWRHWGARRSHPSSTKSPINKTVPSFDANVLQLDKVRNQQEMERLYEAVMAEDDKFNKNLLVEERELDAGTSSSHGRSLSSPSAKSFSQPQPPVYSLTKACEPSVNNLAMSPRSPIGAIYPPHGPMPSDASAATTTHRITSLGIHGPGLPASPRSLRSHVHKSSGTSLRSDVSRSTVDMQPLPSVQRYPNDDDIEARTPLSPRINPYPEHLLSPPLPTGHTVIQDDGEVEDNKDGHYIGEAYSYVVLENPRPPPRPALQRKTSHSSGPPLSPYMHPAYPPPSQPYSSAATNALPFRSLNSLALTGSNAHYLNPTSPGPMKVTYLEARREHSHGMWSARGPRAGGLLSAGLPTPYSPYMPFTPVTPVTPHLTSREERRQKARDNGRRAATREDEVIPEKDMWGEAW